MNYNHSLNNGGGWPLNLFLTPDLEPVFGGTYWAGPGVRQRTESGGADEPLEFLVILEKLQDVWPAEESRVRAEAKQSVVDLRQYSGEGTLSGDEPDEVDLDQIEEAYARIGGTFDPMFGGFGPNLSLNPGPNNPSPGAGGPVPGPWSSAGGELPKFPTTAKLSLLLRATRFPAPVRDVVGAHDSAHVSAMALHTLRRMLQGGMRDHVGGGFHRHSVARDWSLPSFEKMLADNALLLGLYLDAWLLLGGAPDGEFAAAVLELADYITSSPIHIASDAESQGRGGGGFITSEAADSLQRRGDRVKRQGAYYLWTRKEFDTVAGGGAGAGANGAGAGAGDGDGDGDEGQATATLTATLTLTGATAAAVAAAHWDVQEHGNVDPSRDPNDEFLNQNVLRVVRDEARLAKQFGMPEARAARLVADARRRLRAHRRRERVPPDRDAKVVVAHNGMAIGALARTAAALAHTYTHARAAGNGVSPSSSSPSPSSFAPPSFSSSSSSTTTTTSSSSPSPSSSSPPSSYADWARRYLAAAERAALFIRRELWDEDAGVLYRAFSYSSGDGDGDGGRLDGVEGFAEDYAFLIEGLLELYEATADASWLAWARRLQDQQIAFFYDGPNNNNNHHNHHDHHPHSPATATTTTTTTAAAAAAAGAGAGADVSSHARCGAFYSTRLGARHTIIRIKDAMDSAQPSANAVSASNLFRLGALLASTSTSSSSSTSSTSSTSASSEGAAVGDRYTAIAKQSVRAFGVEMLEHPHLFPGLLCGVVPLKLGGRHWVIATTTNGGGGGGGGGGGAETEATIREFRRAFHKAPRAGLFTLSFRKVDGAAAAGVPGDRSTGTGTGIDGPGIYAFETGGTYRRLALGDPDLLEVIHGPDRATTTATATPTTTTTTTDGRIGTAG